MVVVEDGCGVGCCGVVFGFVIGFQCVYMQVGYDVELFVDFLGVLQEQVDVGQFLVGCIVLQCVVGQWQLCLVGCGNVCGLKGDRVGVGEGVDVFGVLKEGVEDFVVFEVYVCFDFVVVQQQVVGEVVVEGFCVQVVEVVVLFCVEGQCLVVVGCVCWSSCCLDQVDLWQVVVVLWVVFVVVL